MPTLSSIAGIGNECSLSAYSVEKIVRQHCCAATGVSLDFLKMNLGWQHAQRIG
jgi:hypothetical protein